MSLHIMVICSFDVDLVYNCVEMYLTFLLLYSYLNVCTFVFVLGPDPSVLNSGITFSGLWEPYGKPGLYLGWMLLTHCTISPAPLANCFLIL